MSLPVVVLSTVDPVLQETALFGALTDQPGTAVLRHALDPSTGTLHRVISDQNGVHEDVTILLAHACFGCAIRDDALPALQRMSGSGRWERIVLALPVGAGPAAPARALAGPGAATDLGVELAGLVSAIGTDATVDDLLGADLLDERGLALTAGDRRAVGEALAAQLRQADLVLTTGSDPVGSALIDHLRAGGTDRVDLFDAGSQDVFRRRYDHAAAEIRIDPRTVTPSDHRDRHGVWTLDLWSRRPLHPGRFLDRIEDLGAGRQCSRGRFQLAGRPEQVGEWDGSGGQVSLGDAGSWSGFAPSTRLVFTGVDDDRERIRRAFGDLPLTDDEIARGANARLGVQDGLEPWLGASQAA